MTTIIFLQQKRMHPTLRSIQEYEVHRIETNLYPSAEIFWFGEKLKLDNVDYDFDRMDTGHTNGPIFLSRQIEPFTDEVSGVKFAV